MIFLVSAKLTIKSVFIKQELSEDSALDYSTVYLLKCKKVPSDNFYVFEKIAFKDLKFNIKSVINNTTLKLCIL